MSQTPRPLARPPCSRPSRSARPAPATSRRAPRPAATTWGGSDDASAAQLGCFQADKSGRMTLFFGAPTTVRGGYGATLWGAPDLTIHEIGERIKSVVRGFAYCRQNASHRLLIGMGTSNSAIDGKDDAWLRAHGDLWSRTVEALAAWVNRYYPGYAADHRRVGRRAVVVDVPEGRAVDARLRRLPRAPRSCTPTRRPTAAPPARPPTPRATTAGRSSTSGTCRGTTTRPSRSRRSTPTAATRPGSGS